MEEKIDLKKAIKENLLDLKDIDLGILEAYLEMPDNFKKYLIFSDYYNYHRQRIEEEVLERESEEAIENLSSPNLAEIPLEDKCKNCNSERRAYDDKDFCPKCILIFKEDSDKTQQELKESLLKDNNFQKLSSEVAAIAYVKNKHSTIKHKNKFVPLTAIAKETYQLKKMESN